MNDSHPSRRDLITGKPLRGDGKSEETPDAFPTPAASMPDSDKRREEAYVEHLSKSAMACQFEFVFNAGQYPDAADAAMEAFEQIDALEEQLTIYRPTSEVSRVNQTAANGAIQVESGLFELLQLSRQLYDQTEGAFDVTAGELSRLWGFSRREGKLPDDGAIEQALRHIGMDQVLLDEANQSVRFLDAQVSIDLGGIGKGFAVDRCVSLLAQHGLDHFMIHGGQSSIVARGERTGNSRRQRAGWVVGLCHPVWPEQRLGEIELVDQALGTSGTSRQSFYHNGKRYGHILDPRSGQPAEAVLQSTVIASTAAEADALATACYVLGVERTALLCEQRTDIAAILVTSASRRGQIDVHTFGLNADRWRLANG